MSLEQIHLSTSGLRGAGQKFRPFIMFNSTWEKASSSLLWEITSQSKQNWENSCS